MDDDPWSIDRSNPSYAVLSDPALRARLSDNLRVASAVTVTRKPLADVVRQHTDAPIYVLPNCIPEWLLSWQKPAHPLKKHDTTIVGWSGSAHHRMDWENYAGRLVQWLQRTPQAILHLMGAAEYLGVHHREFPPGRVTATGWNGDIEQYFRSIPFDIAILPLKKHPFNESKSPIAALIYAALGIPVVASDVGPYHDFVVPNETGLLFRTPGEMAQHLTTLMRDADLRAYMGANARFIATHHTFEKNSWKWEAVLL